LANDEKIWLGCAPSTTKRFSKQRAVVADRAEAPAEPYFEFGASFVRGIKTDVMIMSSSCDS